MRIDADAGEGKLGHIRAADQDFLGLTVIGSFVTVLGNLIAVYLNIK
jgi:hypothetical protein